MKIAHILLLLLFAVGMGFGQLLLKFAAQRQAPNVEQDLVLRLLTMVFDWPFVLGAAWYALMLVYWVWLLTFLPLSRAYPFTLVSLAVAAVGSSIFFQEQLSARFGLGLLVIAAGLLLVAAE
jgi:multidrug transporter EmrE-like cation transporter